jgi:uncharacterized circularly permuted ATP-grasp superfamily protein/uncharacterized alpha-E superfamily protein
MSTISSPEIDAQAGPFLRGYRGLGGFDEMVEAGGTLREHWQTFAQALENLGHEEFRHRWQEAKDLIRANGVTYNVYGDPRGLDRPWQLDPLPILIDPKDASFLESGLCQRARLLEAILADLYGPQQLLKASLIPTELVFANPGFLRSCHGLRVPGNRYLHLVAMDLGRGPDGTLYVLGDRTQAPSGAGYALENRIVASRMLPEIFRDCRVQRMAMFFRTLRHTLRGLAPLNRDNPRIVLLTPGPFNETYFEHAYLARYLGYTLVEGGDLTVRDNKVFLKLLDGLQPVDVILRRLDDDFCDPLELRGDSFLGVPGLVQAARAGNVAIANCLGSGLVQTPALMPYLPRLCRHVLGEDLHLPSVAAYWCGDCAARDHVLANLPRMVIKPSFPTMRFNPVFGEKLTREQLQTLADKIRANPIGYVGQDHLSLSTAPVLADDGIQPRHLVVRAYLAATDSSFTLMPGGLSRFTASGETMVVSLQQGGGSKDTWVLSTGPVSTFSLLRPAAGPVELSRGGNDLPSRAADNLFWLGRYVERAESLVRLLRGILVRLTEKSGLADVPELPYLLRALTTLFQSFPGFVGDGAEARLAHPEEELYAMVFDQERAGSLAYTLHSLYRVAGSVRDRISLDMWRVLSGLDLFDHRQHNNWTSEEAQELTTLSDLLDLLNRSVITLAAFGGLAMESMTRGHGWRFLDMGRKVERSLHMVGLIRATLATVPAHEGPLLEALLEIADSSMTFRRRYLSSLEAAPVLDLLLADESNPRSLAYQLVCLNDDVNHLPREAAHAGRGPEQRLALALLTAVQLADIDRLAAVSSKSTRPHLQELLARLEADLPVLSDHITHHFLSHLQTSRHLASAWQQPIEETK